MKSQNRRHDRQFFYKYTSMEAAQSILINRTLRFSSPLIFNDPFDARVIKFDFNGEQFQQQLNIELAHIIEDGAAYGEIENLKVKALLELMQGTSQDELACIAKKLRKSNDTAEAGSVKELEKEMQNVWDGMMPKNRILCLSEVHDNPAMWAHYADNYKGVVLELECLDIYDSPLLVANKVTYSDQVPTYGTLDEHVKMNLGLLPKRQMYEEFLQRLECTKKMEWAHEQEWRVATMEKNSNELYSDFKMHPRTFTKIYLGKDVSSEDKLLIKNILKHGLSHVEIFEMELSYEEGRITFKLME